MKTVPMARSRKNFLTNNFRLKSLLRGLEESHSKLSTFCKEHGNTKKFIHASRLLPGG